MTEAQKASKRHCWPDSSLAQAYEAGFLNGAAFVTVFFRCTNPDVGVIKRVAKDQSWAIVKWTHNPTRKAETKNLVHLCPVLNAYLVKRGDAQWSIGLNLDWPEES